MSKVVKIYKVIPSISAPKLEIFNGDLEGCFSGKNYCDGKVDKIYDWNYFYSFGNSFGIAESAWEKCKNIYYSVIECDVELPLIIVNDSLKLTLIHPDLVDPPSDGDSFCDLKYTNSLFRLNDQTPDYIYCIEGRYLPQDEFKGEMRRDR
ncbi:hypothetical protein LNTAR_18383 [Lentisphaera araneosa HTCC2155]|jgi:hypothetical protein|uniref:Uncharacterized protein n=1 Tax=Lentisphaera araneosa HTCC2155 TaxID=313628 RepID=A6DG15_9BACT|nr:hypothetical protein [Lentisphaera araneosa]EDM29745.1 hypothetical protein LNTAR_18383 [Lentisphaera araneosa HTCC2155]